MTVTQKIVDVVWRFLKYSPLQTVIILQMQFIMIYQTKLPFPGMSEFVFDTKIQILQRQSEELPAIHNSPSSLKYCLLCGRK